MNESFGIITKYIHYKLDLIENELEKSEYLQISRAPSNVRMLVMILVMHVKRCKANPIFDKLSQLGEDEVLSNLCTIYDSSYRMENAYFENLGQIDCEGDSACNIYELLSDITSDILHFLQTKHVGFRQRVE